MVFTKPNTPREEIKEHIINAAKEIIIRADDIIGDLDGCRTINIGIAIEPLSIVTISVNRELISAHKLNKIKEVNCQYGNCQAG